VSLFLWLFPTGTVIFEETIPFCASNGNGWRSRIHDGGRPLLLVKTIVRDHDWYHEHDHQVYFDKTSCPIETKTRNLFEKGD
jgi:hypothetical protein